MIPPKWFSTAMQKHFGCDPSISAPSEISILFDHMRRDGDTMISEPYLDVLRAVHLAMKIAKKIGCKWHIEVEGDWHPKTCRIEFHPRDAKPSGPRPRYRMREVRAALAEGAD
jgi:hypothetical protein